MDALAVIVFRLYCHGSLIAAAVHYCFAHCCPCCPVGVLVLLVAVSFANAAVVHAVRHHKQGTSKGQRRGNSPTRRETTHQT